MFAVESGVRQGNTLLPCIFDVVMNAFIVNLRLLDVGCNINHQYVRCFLYADDIILMSPSIISLQQMLVVCSATAKSFAFKFIGNKSHCLSFGKRANVDIGRMLFDNQSIARCHSIKYHGVHLLSGKGLTFGIAPIKRAFYASCNFFFILIGQLSARKTSLNGTH